MRAHKFKLLNLMLLSLLLMGCGYHFGHSGLSREYSTISVPYVEGDVNGGLTAAIVRQIARNGSFEYRVDDGNLLLIAKIVDFDDENIGFRYDRKKKGHLTQTIIPTETRITSIVEVTLLEAASGRVVLEPVRISANVDLDHEYNSSHHEVNVFSLGQLSDADAAFEVAQQPLNFALAQKIVDYICDSW